MKKKWIALLILVIVLALCVGAYFLVTSLTAQKEEAEKAEAQAAQVKLGFGEEQIASITYTWQDDTLTFLANPEKGWVLQGDESFPLNTVLIDSMASKLADVAVVDEIPAPGDLKPFGLAEPRISIKAMGTAGTQKIFTMGNENQVTRDCYTMLAGDSTVYTVSYLIPRSFEYTLLELVNETGYMKGVSDDDLNRVAVATADGKGYSITYNQNSFNWTMEKNGETTQADSERKGEITTACAFLMPSRYVALDADQAALAEYGLDNPRYQVDAEYTKEEEDPETGFKMPVNYATTILLGNTVSIPNEKAVVEEGEEFPLIEYIYATLPGSRLVSLIQYDRILSMLTATDEELSALRVFEFSIGDTTGYSFTLNGETHHVTIENLPATETSRSQTVYYLDGVAQEDSADITMLFYMTKGYTGLSRAEESDKNGEQLFTITMHMTEAMGGDWTVNYYGLDAFTGIAETEDLRVRMDLRNIHSLIGYAEAVLDPVDNLA